MPIAVATPVAQAVPIPTTREASTPAPAASDLPTAARGFLASLGIGAEPEPPPAVKRPRARTLARREGQMAPVRDGNSAPSCGRCDARFGMKTWRHHCRNCGACVCNACCVTWCNFEVPHAFLAGHGEAKAKAPRVCRFCNDAAVAFRRALLSGEATTAQRLIGDGTNNLNVHCALAGAGGLLPIHLAAAANSVATLQWLAEGMQCPMDGPDALTVGKPPKRCCASPSSTRRSTSSSGSSPARARPSRCRPTRAARPPPSTARWSARCATAGASGRQ